MKAPQGSGDPTSKIDTAYSETLRKPWVSWGVRHMPASQMFRFVRKTALFSYLRIFFFALYELSAVRE